MEIKLTQEQIESIQNGEDITIKAPCSEPWEPRGGKWCVTNTGGVITGGSVTNCRKFGVEYQTREMTEKARDSMRKYNRLLVWLSENDDGWKADWNDQEQCKHYIYFCSRSREYATTYNHTTQILITVHMSQDNAEKLCKLLNNKKVIL